MIRIPILHGKAVKDHILFIIGGVMHLAVIIIITVLAAVLAALISFTIKLVNFAFVSPEKKHMTEESMLEVRKKQMPKYADVFTEACERLEEMPSEKVEIRSRDGLRLRGEFFPNPENRGTVVMMHGFRSSPHADMSPICGFYYSLGFSLLLPCQRAHCASEGKYLTFGAKERFDCADWAKYASDRSDGAPVVLDGVSMGAATVIASVSAGLPQSVKCIVADCGYTSPYEEFKHVLKHYVHMPRFPIFYLFAAACRLICGFSIKDFDNREILKSCDLPVLFVHGEKDALVPFSMSLENYEACASEKKLISVPEADHGESYLVDRSGCEKELRDFLDKYA